MKKQLKKITKVVLFGLSYPISETKFGDLIYFMDEEDAKKLAKETRGWYGSTGSVTPKEFKMEESLPHYWESADDWAKANMTYNEYEKWKSK